MVSEQLLKYSENELVDYIANDAGSSKPHFGGNINGKDHLQLQQNPQEFTNLLLFLKGFGSKSYLEIGVGQGGSFLLCSLFQPLAVHFHAVDNCNYMETAAGFEDQEVSILEKVELLKKLKNIDDIKFFNTNSDKWFASNNLSYDTIFIDGDHSYEGVKRDFLNAEQILNKNGCIIFHDIAKNGTGVNQIWEEIDSSRKVNEWILSNFGIGIIK